MLPETTSDSHHPIIDYKYQIESLAFSSPQYGLASSNCFDGFHVSLHVTLVLWYKAVSLYFIAGEVGKPGSSVPVPGPPGQKGDRGAVGAQGAKGEKGQTGKSGAKYVRWGRTTCPSSAEIVYKGTLSDLAEVLIINNTKMTKQNKTSYNT